MFPTDALPFAARYEFVRSEKITVLKPVLVTAPGHPVFSSFMNAYEKIFTLDEERETAEGFERVLELNTDISARKQFGPFQEFILLLMCGDTIAAAVNFILFIYENGQYDPFGASCQVNFIMTVEGYRELGAGTLLVKLTDELLEHYRFLYAAVLPATFITIEQNNPQRMTPAQRSADFLSSGICPQRRMRWWTERGFRKADIDYFQPALNSRSSPCDYLDYYIRINSRHDKQNCIARAVMLEHLRRFFSVSIGKTENPETVSKSIETISCSLENKSVIFLQ